MIVQCPSCKTKFSVDPGKVKETASLRFHCSRCNHYFDLAGRDRAHPAPAKHGTPEGQPHFPPPAAKQLEMTLPEGEFDLPTSSISTSAGADDDDLPMITADWPTHAESEQREVDLSSLIRRDQGEDSRRGPSTTRSFSFSGSRFQPEDLLSESEEIVTPLTVRESGSFLPVIESATEILGPERELPSFSATSPIQNTKADIGELPEPLLPESLPTFDDISAPEEQFTLGTPTEKPLTGASVVKFPERLARSKQRRDLTTTPSELKRTVESNAALPPFETRTGFLMSALPLLAVWFVPAVLFAGLGYWSLNFKDTPAVLLSNLGFEAQSSRQVPPMGVDIVGLRSDFVTLTDGHQLFELRGSVMNSTESEFRELFIEAKLFDRENNLLQRMIVPAVNGLSSSMNISSMKFESLLDNQNRTGISHKLRATEQLPFRLILPLDAPGAAWYSARVYSVRTA